LKAIRDDLQVEYLDQPYWVGRNIAREMGRTLGFNL